MQKTPSFTNKNNFLYLITLSIISLLVCWPLFKENFITTIDGPDALLRLFSMNQFIGKGQWLVRWIPDLHGYGYLEFNFYPPFFTFVGTFLMKIGLSIIWALNLSCFIFILLSAYWMFFFVKEFWGPEGAFLSAIAYIFAPYQMVDLYLRGAYAETASFAFLPLILWAFLNLHKKLNIPYFCMASFSVAGLYLTHNCTTLIFSPIVILYILILHFPVRRQNCLSLLISWTAFILGAGMAAFFWIPALLEKNLVHINFLLNGNLDFHNNFLSFKQLIYSPWPKKPGTPLPYEIGIIHCLLAVLAFFSFSKNLKGQNLLMRQLSFLFAVLIIAVFLTLPFSLKIWEDISILKFIQFPSRLLVIISFIVSIFSGGVISLVPPKKRLILMGFVSLAIMLANLPLCQPTYGTTKVNIKDTPPSDIFRELHTPDKGEYLPIGVKYIRYPIPKEKLEFYKGTGLILNQSTDCPVHLRFNVMALSPSILCLNVFYFPRWVIKVDDHLINIFKDNPFGLIFFPIDQGAHTIKADFEPTPVRLTATIISIICFSILMVLLLYKSFSFFIFRH